MRPQNTILLATRNQGKINELKRLFEPFALQVVGITDFPMLEDVEETGKTFTENSLLKASYAARMTNLVTIADDSGLEVDILGKAPGIYSARFYKTKLELPKAYADLQSSFWNKYQSLKNKSQKHVQKEASNLAALAKALFAITKEDLNQQSPKAGSQLASLSASLASLSADELNIVKLLYLLQNTAPDKKQAHFVCAVSAVRPDGEQITALGTWEGLLNNTLRGSNGFGYDPLFIDKSGFCSAELSCTEKNKRSHRAQALQLLMQEWQPFWEKYQQDYPK